MTASEHKVKFDPPKVALVAKVACPDCHVSYNMIAFSPVTLEGEFYCPNPKCNAAYRMKLLLHDSQKDSVEEMLKLAVLSIQKSRAIDWSQSGLALGRAWKRPPRDADAPAAVAAARGSTKVGGRRGRSHASRLPDTQDPLSSKSSPDEKRGGLRGRDQKPERVFQAESPRR
jgi:hypothetical protein